MIDLTSACQRTAQVLANVSDDQLTARTPCENLRLDELVAHVGVLAHAFTAAARKDFGPMTDTPPTFDGRLDDDWRTAYPQRLAELAAAFGAPAAWEGMSRAGGVDFPGEVAGMVALTEVVVHGWDLARATGQTVGFDDALAGEILGFARQTISDDTRAPRIGPEVPAPDGASASAIDRLVAFMGRTP